MSNILKLNKDDTAENLVNYIEDTIKLFGKSKSIVKAVNNMSVLTEDLTEVFLIDNKDNINPEKLINVYLSIIELSYIFGINLIHHMESKIKYTYPKLREMLDNGKETK